MSNDWSNPCMESLQSVISLLKYSPSGRTSTNLWGNRTTMTIRWTMSPVHDSLQIYFQSDTSSVLLDTLGKDNQIKNVQMSPGSGISVTYFIICSICWPVNSIWWLHGKMERQVNSQLIDGYNFPTAVCESGWAEKLDDLRKKATLCLMHTDWWTNITRSHCHLLSIFRASQTLMKSTKISLQTNRPAVWFGCRSARLGQECQRRSTGTAGSSEPPCESFYEEWLFIRRLKACI